MSPANRTGLTQEIAPGKGKLRTIRLRYSKRLLESEVSSNGTNPTCVATNQRGDCYEEYTIDPDVNYYADELIKASDLSRTCLENSQIFTEAIARLVDVVERKVASAMTTDAAALTGAWATDVQNVVANQLNIKTLKDSTTDEVYPFTMEEIDTALTQTGYCGQAAIFSGTKLYQYFKRVLAGCCADQGIDLGELMARYGKAVMYDRRVVSAFGDNDNAVVTQPGALQILYYTLNDWKEGVPAPVQNGGNYFSQVIVSPRTGLPMDLNVKDDCGNVSIVVTATPKIVGMPTDLFPVGDVYQNVNFFNEILVANV